MTNRTLAILIAPILAFAIQCDLWSADVVIGDTAYDVSDYIDGVRYRHYVTKTVAESEPEWSIEKDNEPPLSAKAAYLLAKESLRSNDEIRTRGSWRLESIALIQIHGVLYPTRWMWRVSFIRAPESNAGSGPGTYIRIPVLMSGKSAGFQTVPSSAPQSPPPSK